MTNYEKIKKIAALCFELVEKAEGHQVVCYFSDLSSSRLLLKTLSEMLSASSNGKISLLNKNEELRFETKLGYKNTVNSFAATKETLRGTGCSGSGTVFLIDSYRMDEEVVRSIRSPLYARKDVHLIEA